ncbi:MAG: hypothetical protein QT02_C0007G0003 [archaeon GW2011_AR9]|nr:MAG: hypothetical protein QT02_C0007G0003 [archaeon GW2011_AR9]
MQFLLNTMNIGAAFSYYFAQLPRFDDHINRIIFGKAVFYLGTSYPFQERG